MKQQEDESRGPKARQVIERYPSQYFPGYLFPALIAAAGVYAGPQAATAAAHRLMFEVSVIQCLIDTEFGLAAESKEISSDTAGSDYCRVR